ncbi:HAD-like domain-containing protein [Gautieria morchelliformis]|nr:HAD-like domain-containing protein [Gautieria morchelliformis]
MALPSPEDIKLIITDVDGTLLTSEHVIHPRTLSAFTKLRAAHPNLPIVIASGKQYNSCLWIRHALCLPPHFPATHCNGALIYGGLSGACLSEFSASLPPAVVAHIVDGTNNFGTFVFTEDAAVLVSPGVGVHKKDWCEVAARYDKGVQDCSQEPDRSEFLQKIASGDLLVPKVTICSDDSDLDSAQRALDALTHKSPSPFMVTRAIPWIFEAICPSVHKGKALRQICQSLGNVTPEQVLAFGDGENDIDMFQTAGFSVAMGNAMPAAVAAAKYITTSNNEGGVGNFIKKVWNI